jgi:tRNA A37 methylthiotransferase MiaB
VAPAIKKARAAKMRALGAKKKEDFCRRFVGRNVPVLVEEAAEKKSGAQKGYSRNYLPVLVAAARDKVNREVEVAVEAFDRGWLSGKVVHNPAGRPAEA